ncbi:serine/threonine-protein kinase pim-2-like [Anguilla anguilla]|uniref:serine/threonine-protein kinase pim-2-like n=1 Tax=Anguilla anguilla TaxID=7936 RepID=UPI0015AAC0FE|nr:serine/threonine-protein kinase pim-2-like [Anguilla anguilla]
MTKLHSTQSGRLIEWPRAPPGYSCHCSPSCTAGTCLHMPPECYLRSEFHAVPSTVWQLGIVLYQMLTRILPFSTPKEIIYQELYLWQELTNECKDLLQRCLDKRLRGRPTLEEILQHAWFQ